MPSLGDRRRGRLGQQRGDERPRRRTVPLARSNGKTDRPPVPTDDERRRKADNPIQSIQVPVAVEHEGERQTQLLGVLPGRLLLLPRIDADDDESPLRELALESLQRGHLRTALETPARPEVQNDY